MKVHLSNIYIGNAISLLALLNSVKIIHKDKYDVEENKNDII